MNDSVNLRSFCATLFSSRLRRVPHPSLLRVRIFLSFPLRALCASALSSLFLPFQLLTFNSQPLSSDARVPHSERLPRRVGTFLSFPLRALCASALSSPFLPFQPSTFNSQPLSSVARVPHSERFPRRVGTFPSSLFLPLCPPRSFLCDLCDKNTRSSSQLSNLFAPHFIPTVTTQ